MTIDSSRYCLLTAAKTGTETSPKQPSSGGATPYHDQVVPSTRTRSPDQSARSCMLYLVVNTQLYEWCVTLERFDNGQDSWPRDEVWFHVQALQCVIDLQHFCQRLWEELAVRQEQSTLEQQRFNSLCLQRTLEGPHRLSSFAVTRWETSVRDEGDYPLLPEDSWTWAFWRPQQNLIWRNS